MKESKLADCGIMDSMLCVIDGSVELKEFLVTLIESDADTVNVDHDLYMLMNACNVKVFVSSSKEWYDVDVVHGADCTRDEEDYEQIAWVDRYGVVRRGEDEVRRPVCLVYVREVAGNASDTPEVESVVETPSQGIVGRLVGWFKNL